MDDQNLVCAAYLASSRSCSGPYTTRRDTCTRGAVRSSRHVRMSCVLLRPSGMVSLRRMALVMGHVVSLLGVRRVGRIGRAGCSNGRIYRYLTVRLHVWWVMMVILLAIMQRHGRTCCLCHTCCARVAIMLLLVCVSLLLLREEIRIQVGRTR